MNKSKANLAVIITILFALIPKLDKAIKRQMLSLTSLVISIMFVLTPFAPVASASGPVSYTIHKSVIDIAGEGPAGNVTKAGDIISYQVNVTNDGNLNFTNVNVTDPLIKLTGPVESNSNDSILEAGEIWTYDGNYTVTQEDISNNGTIGDGFIVNNATATVTIIGLQNDSVKVPIEQKANCTIDKTVIDVAGKGPGGNVTAEGDIVTYQVNVTNNGNVNLTNVTVTDPLINNLTGPSRSINNDTVLNTGETWTYTGNHTVTRADITSNDGGGLVNNATVDSGQLDPQNDSVQIPIDPRCSIENIVTNVTHISGNGPEGNVTAAGDIISYQVNVTNNGIVNLTNVTVTDSSIDNLTGNNDTVLNSGETWIYTGNYTVSQEDINSNGSGTGFIINNASINCDQLGPKNDTVQVPIKWKPDYTLNKTVTGINGQEPGGNITKVGDIVSYQINVTNDGGVDLTNVTVTDPLINNLTGPTSSINNDTVLNAGESWIYTGNHTITRADLTNNDGDGFINNATVDSDQLDPRNDSVQMPIDTVFSIDQTVTDVAGKGPLGNVTAAGDTIGYQVNVTNNGKTDLINGTINDSLFGNFSGPTGDDVDPGVLNPGETWTYNGNYTVNQADQNNNGTAGNGFIENTASMNFDQLGPKKDTVRVPIERSPHYSITKSVINPDEGGDCIINSPGDEIPYRIAVCNDGNVDLTGVSVNDPMIALTGPAGDGNDPGVLNPGETWVYNGIYRLTPNDINNGNGYIDNTANVISNELPEKSGDVIQSIDKKVDLSIQKSLLGIDETGDFMINNPGDVINYQIAVENNGNADLHHVHVTDSLIDDLSGPAGDVVDRGVLNPGETWVYKGDYAVTQEDITNNGKDGSGFIINTATVSCDEHASESSGMQVPIIRPIDNGDNSDNNSVRPVADFSTSATSGFAPLSVQFTDNSQNAASWSWDFNNDGVADSSAVSPAYTYTNPGTYIAKLTASNANGTDSKTAAINVLEASSSGGGGSSGGSGHSNGGSIGNAAVGGGSSGSNIDTNATANVTQTENNTLNQSNEGTIPNVKQTPKPQATSTPAKQSKKTPGFEVFSGITALLATLFLYRRR